MKSRSRLSRHRNAPASCFANSCYKRDYPTFHKPVRHNHMTKAAAGFKAAAFQVRIILFADHQIILTNRDVYRIAIPDFTG